MAEDLISKYIDRVSFEADTKFAIDELARLEAAYIKLRDIRVNLQAATGFKDISTTAAAATTSITGLTTAIAAQATTIGKVVQANNQQNASLQQNIKTLNDYKSALAANAALQKQALQDVESGKINADEYRLKITQLTEAQFKYKQAISDVTKEIKSQTQLKFAAPNSILEARTQNAQLTRQRDNTPVTDLATIAELNELLDRNNKLIDANSDSLAKQKINIGNYEGSAKIIVDALEKEKKKLEELLKARQNVQNAGATFSPGSGPINKTTVTGFAGGGATGGLAAGASAATTEIENLNAEIEKSRTIIQGFQRVADQPTFLNVAGKVGDATAELRFFTKALIDLERQGQGNSQAAIELRKHLAELTDEVGDTRAEIKALSSDTRAFDLFAGSISFAADAFQTFAGAAALAGASEEDAAEATKTLVAIQSVANGVKGIANELTTKGTAANKLYAFAQGQVSLAMDGSVAAAVRLRAALVTVGFGAIIVGIGLLITNFSKIKEAISGVTKAQAALNETYADYRKGSEEAIVTTNKVKLAFDQAKEGVISKDAALKIYNESLGDAFGKTNSLAEAEKLYNEKAPAYIQIMGLKAQANQLFALSAQAAAKGITAANEDQITFFEKFKLSLTPEAFFGGITPEQMAKKQAELGAAVRAQAEKDAKALFDEGAKIATQAEKLSQTSKVTTDKPDKPDTKAANEAKKRLEDRLKAELDAEKKQSEAIKSIALQRANELIRVNQAIVDNENASLEERSSALNVINTQRKRIAAIEYADAVANEVKIEDAKRVVIVKSQKEIEAATLAHGIKLNIIDEETGNKSVEIKKKNGEKLLAAQKEAQQEELDILENDIEIQRDADEKRYNDAVIALNKRYADGKLSKEKYDAERLKLDNDYQTESLKRELEYQKKLILISALSSDAKKAALKEISRLEKELSEKSIEVTKSEAQKKRDAWVKAIGEYQKIANDVAGVVGGFFEANATRQKNALKAQSDEAERNAAREIELVNASTESEEKKAARIVIINARLAAQKDAIAQKEKQADLQKARFDKSVAIFNIILNTAAAVVKALPNIPLAIGVGALGAAQLAVAFATPIPRYKRGKNDSYEGPAIWGDGGVPEYKVDPHTGSIEVSPTRDTLTHVKKSDIIYPNFEAMMRALAMPALMPFKDNVSREESFAKLEQGQKRQTQLLQQIAAKPVLQQSANDSGMVNIWKWGSRQVQYVDENTNW